MKGSSRGMPDRHFKIRVCEGKGIEVRTAGSAKAVTLSWRQLLAQVLLHHGEIP
jgi:hypothetical protein